MLLGRVSSNINAGDDPLEEVVVDSLDKGISAGFRGTPYVEPRHP